MTTPMTQEEFAHKRVSFGDDLAAWPDIDQTRAKAFLETPEGIGFRDQENQLDALMQQAVSQFVPAHDADAFLDRLLDIPAAHAQSSAPENKSILDFLRGIGGWVRAAFSPVGLVSQGVGYALVLVAGVVVGLQQQPSSLAETVDLSTSLFSSDITLYLEDQ